MKTVAALAFAASLATAQVTYNSTTGTFSCAIPNGNYCAGDSLSTNIIIRCNNGVGGPGNCNDNLSGEPPMGVFGSLCYQSSTTAGDANCEKNCVVYAQPSFTLPASVCQPSFTASTSSAASTSTSTKSGSAVVTGTTTTVVTGTTTTVCPSSSTTMSTVTGNGGTTAPPSNGTVTSTVTGSKTPVGPTSSTSSPTSVVTAGAAVQKAGGALAVAGLVAAYFI